MPPSAGSSPSIRNSGRRSATRQLPVRSATDAMGRLRDLLDELHAREAAVVLADDTRAQHGWDSEGGGGIAADSTPGIAEDLA
jgi:hypothetical protein